MANNTISETEDNDYSDFEPVRDYSGFIPVGNSDQPWLNDPVVNTTIETPAAEPWLNDLEVVAQGQGYATTFADQNDINANHNATSGGVKAYFS